MEDIDFQRTPVKDLQDFLKMRGISVTNIPKLKLVELCVAVKNLNLDVDPDFVCDQAQISSDIQAA